MRYAVYTVQDEVIIISAPNAAAALKKVQEEGYKVVSVVQLS